MGVNNGYLEQQAIEWRPPKWIMRFRDDGSAEGGVKLGQSRQSRHF